MSIRVVSGDETVLHDKRLQYFMTKSPEIKSMQKLEDDTIIEVRHICIFEDAKENGETVALLSLMDLESGEVISVQSETFKKSFEDIIELFYDGDLSTYDGKLSIKKISGVSKSGRDYIDCVLA